MKKRVDIKSWKVERLWVERSTDICCNPNRNFYVHKNTRQRQKTKCLHSVTRFRLARTGGDRGTVWKHVCPYFALEPSYQTAVNQRVKTVFDWHVDVQGPVWRTVVPVQAIRTYGGSEVDIQTFLTSARGGNCWLSLCSDRFASEEKAPQTHIEDIDEP
jgi:hypothetical protein